MGKQEKLYIAEGADTLAQDCRLNASDVLYSVAPLSNVGIAITFITVLPVRL